jgi:small subunit ribosomal protein S8
MTFDPVSDLFTKIRNASLRKNRVVILPSTKLTRGIVNVLASEGVIETFQENLECFLGTSIIVLLKYRSKLILRRPVIKNIQRISKPGLRQYVRWNKIPSIAGGKGIVILSTSKGIISGRVAKSTSIGGEILGIIHTTEAPRYTD